MQMTRRTFLAAPVAAAATAQENAQDNNDPLRFLISDADLVYTKPVARSEEGLPVGNGRMGTLVWTTPESLRMQINRVDVYANNSFERHNDYCGGCGFVDIDFGRDLFPESGFPQRLSVYDGLLKVASVEMVAWPVQDVIAVHVQAPAEVNLRMLRAENKYYGGQLENMIRDHVVTVQTRNHTAASRLEIRGECVVLTQEFREGDYCCKSAVAVSKGKGADPERDGAAPGSAVWHGADRERGHVRRQGRCRGPGAAPTRSRFVQRLFHAAQGGRGLVARVLVAVELESLASAECRVRNPWSGELQRFARHKGERIVLRKP
jgi:hypothetical protein